jgi:hypothetical protein
MNIAEIIEQLRGERGRLDAAIQALEDVGGRNIRSGKTPR